MIHYRQCQFRTNKCESSRGKSHCCNKDQGRAGKNKGLDEVWPRMQGVCAPLVTTMVMKVVRSAQF